MTTATHRQPARAASPLDDPIFDDLFQGCALAAYLDVAHAEQAWPSTEATRMRAYHYYENCLAERCSHDHEKRNSPLPVI